MTSVKLPCAALEPCFWKEVETAARWRSSAIGLEPNRQSRADRQAVNGNSRSPQRRRQMVAARRIYPARRAGVMIEIAVAHQGRHGLFDRHVALAVDRLPLVGYVSQQRGSGATGRSPTQQAGAPISGGPIVQRRSGASPRRAGSQCWVALPFSILQLSNQVVV